MVENNSVSYPVPNNAKSEANTEANVELVMSNTNSVEFIRLEHSLWKHLWTSDKLLIFPKWTCNCHCLRILLFKKSTRYQQCLSGLGQKLLLKLQITKYNCQGSQN